MVSMAIDTEIDSAKGTYSDVLLKISLNINTTKVTERRITTKKIISRHMFIDFFVLQILITAAPLIHPTHQRGVLVGVCLSYVLE